MQRVFVVTTFFFTSSIAFAQQAFIYANGPDGKVSFALDASKTPRINGDAKSNPTVKDFREGSDYSDACYQGNDAGVKALLKSLVEAANGDGDSRANLLSLTEERDVYSLEVEFEDESSKYEDTFAFDACQ